jgi:hypothetical protein
MSLKNYFFLIFGFFVINICYANDNKNKRVDAVRVVNSIKIDGVVNPEEWTSASTLDNFVEFRPNPGQAELQGHRTL